MANKENKHKKQRPPERSFEHRVKSAHAGEGTTESYVRIRHPEGQQHNAEPPPRETYMLDIPGNTPGNDVINLDSVCEPAADTACYLLDDFNRTLTGNSYSTSGDGGAWPAISKFQGDHIESGLTLEDGGFNYSAVTDWRSGQTGNVSSFVGNYAWASTNPDRPASDCASGFLFTGYTQYDAWAEYVVPEHPTDLAGITLGPITFHDNDTWGGTSAAEGAWLIVSSSEPTAIGQGTVVTHLPQDTATTVFIPGSLIPAEGETMYIGVTPRWGADLGEWGCGYNWPFNTGEHDSGAGKINNWTDTITWKSWDSDADAWGAGLSGDTTGAWWDGNLPWDVSASGGTFGYNGDALYLTVAAGTQETLTAKMLGSSLYNPADGDDTSYQEPWTEDSGINMKARWRLTTAGDVTEAGSRYLYFKWHDGRDEQTVTIDLGDIDNAQGINLTQDINSSTLVKDITEGSWMWVRVDTRNPDYIRAKMWVEGGTYGSGEPPVWDVAIGRASDSENPTRDDYFEIGMSVGNETGANQTVEVGDVWFCGAGEDCEWVTEKIGEGDGTSVTFVTSQAFKAGALWFFIDGFHVRTVTTDLEKGEFRPIESIAPASKATLVARYLVNSIPT